MQGRIGAYELLDRIGQGATSDVYRARHLTLDREAAVKVLLPRLTGSEPARAMFLRESRLIARLDHPNVVRVHEAGEHDGALFIAMELVDGQDLKSVLDTRGRLSIDETLDVVRQVAAALDAAHADGLVHRDVKPSNILLAGDGSGRVLLTDFGLTTARDSSTRVSGAGHLVGSIPYMPPEQLEGREVSPRSDVYALACVVYECLVGSPPFERATDVEVLWAHIRDAPAAPSQADPLLRVVDRAVLHALAKSPEDRPVSAAEFFDYLCGARACSRRQRRALHRRGRPTSRTRIVAAAAGMAVAAAAAVLTWQGGAQPGTPVAQSAVIAGAAPGAGPAAPAAERQDEHRTVGAATAGELPAAPASGSPETTSSSRPARSPAGGAVTGLTAAAPPPVAVQPRVESLRYDASPVVDCVEGTPEQVGCVQLETRPGESSIHVSISDQTRMPVRAWIRQDVDRDGDFDGDWIEICAQTDRPVPVHAGAIVNISLETGRCGSEGRSVPTSGLVTVSLFGQR